eukprot:GHVH01014140.1.p1 GENE.GHVH01014140.1~~GHVH01014140.1.p1  ORF type:complete len:190 (+),score=15.38 GHVH01014140.1:563-1132(+)
MCSVQLTAESMEIRCSIRPRTFSIIADHSRPGCKYAKILKRAASLKECETVVYSMQYFAPSVAGLKKHLDQARQFIQRIDAELALGTLRQAAETLTNQTVSRVNYDDVLTIPTNWSKAGVGVVVSVKGKPFLAATIPNSQLISSLPAPIGELIGIGLAMIKFDFIKSHKIALHVDAQAAVKAIGNNTID